MKRLLNTLYVTTPDTYLAKEGETVVVRDQGKKLHRVPIHNLEGIVALGRIGASPDLMELCGERGVSLSFMTEQGRFKARVVGPVSGNVLLRRAHYRLADDPKASAGLARSMVAAKIANCRQILLRAGREKAGEDSSQELKEAARRMERVLSQLLDDTALETIRGREGEAARIYFSVFSLLVNDPDNVFPFERRNRRPPLDPVNSLLSFLYSVLTNDLVSALEGTGLDPAVGFLHQDRPGRPGLALDLMEELRPILVDRVVLTLINRRQVAARGFRKTETGAVIMDDDTRKTVITAYQKRKQDIVRHPYLGEKVPYGLIAHLQARLLARHIRGDLDGYPPFVWR